MSRMPAALVLLVGHFASPGCSTNGIGEGGKNDRADVKRAQSLLNLVPHESGGPRPALVVDGLVRPETIETIRRFQRIQLDLESGRIDRGSPSWERLAEFEDFSGPRPGAPIAWGKQVTAPFKVRVVDIAGELKASPDHLMAAMAFETGESFSPAIKNAAGSGAVGLIQFMPDVAHALGTTTDTLKRMSAVKQLAYVREYLAPYTGQLANIDDVYMAILLPAAIGKPDGHILYDKRTMPLSYDQNRGLDANDDGKITKAEAAAKVRTKLAKGLEEANKG